MLSRLQNTLRAYLRPLPLDPQRYVFRKRLSSGVIGVQLNKAFPPIRLRKRATDGKVFNDVFFKHDYAISVPEKPQVIVDCGANIGLATLYFAQRFLEATVIAVEPEANNFDLLRQNTEGYKNVHAVQAGVWSHPAHLKVNDDGWGEWAFTVEEVPEGTPGAIRAVSLKDMIRQFGLTRIDILKVDIEGSEKELFESGAEAWLPLVKIIIVELHDRFKQGCTAALLKALAGYDFTLEPFGECLVVRINGQSR